MRYSKCNCWSIINYIYCNNCYWCYMWILCCIIYIGIAYCVCGGALCCAALSKPIPNQGKASFIPTSTETATRTQMV